MQTLENSTYPIIDARDFSVATGNRLDGIGQIVNEPRAGKTDDLYRIYITARMIVNLSEGNVEDLFSLFRTLTNNVSENITYTEFYPASFEILVPDQIQDAATAFTFNTFLQQARAIAIGANYIYFPDTDIFQFSSTSSVEVDSSLGFGDIADSNVGGKFAGALGPGSSLSDTSTDAGAGSPSLFFGLEV